MAFDACQITDIHRIDLRCFITFSIETVNPLRSQTSPCNCWSRIQTAPTPGWEQWGLGYRTPATQASWFTSTFQFCAVGHSSFVGHRANDLKAHGCGQEVLSFGYSQRS